MYIAQPGGGGGEVYTCTYSDDNLFQSVLFGKTSKLTQHDHGLAKSGDGLVVKKVDWMAVFAPPTSKSTFMQ